MTRLVGLWLTLLIFLSGPALEGKVRFGDFTFAAESGAGDAVFWSGRQGANRAAAEAFAKATGNTTLEMTPVGQALEAQGAGIDAWRAASADFARGASGDVTAFAGGSSPGSVWLTVEKPILMQNPNVTRIIIKDAVNTAKTTIIYPH